MNPKDSDEFVEPQGPILVPVQNARISERKKVGVE
jgi:hypothetical protein